ncbi:TROVE domain-containing protein [Brucella cytisi]|uniref:RNA-binding protein n=1 Tax=Brucella cytisi TaxID=407152 RepID=A0A1J6HBP1_9HYPH|nr:TROVE domain-containing protein [Brucella cytisi]OIS90556.1 RNA-binding protein [Brucella cytisi]
MVNKAIFKTYLGKLLPSTNTVNEAGAPAYKLTPKEALAQLAVTGTFNGTFYADGETQVNALHELSSQVEPEFLARLAVYAAQKGLMKDMPVTLLALLSTLQSNAFAAAFPQAVKSGKMLRGFVQVMRSGAMGRKSLGTRPKKMVQSWLETASTRQLLNAMVGSEPSLADVVKMVHPKPANEERKAFYAWMIGKPYDYAALPVEVKALEEFRRDLTKPVPDVPFQLLTSLPLTREHWAGIARNGSWQMVRQNLNTFARKGVFDVEGMTKEVAHRLSDPEAVRKARVFPYQLMTTWKAASEAVPEEVREALQQAMNAALANVPALDGRVVLCPDVSGSMGSSVTGHRKGATSIVRCIDVAGLMTAAFLQRNPNARVMPFEYDVVDVRLNRRDSVMTNAAKLASIGGGGTNCSAPLARLADERAKVDLVVFISDNQSWVEQSYYGSASTKMKEWARIKRLNPAAKLVCLDIQPYQTTQAQSRNDVLNIGGFSDAVFEVIAAFADGESDLETWPQKIEAVELQ